MRHHVSPYRSFARLAALLVPLCGSCFAQGQCSSNTVRGTWAFQGHGTAMINIPASSTPVPVPFVSLGTMKIDSQGRYTAHGTISLGGQIQEMDFPGSIQVNADCTASDTCTIGSLPCADRLVILDNGNEMRALPTQHPVGPVAEIGYFRRISWGEPHCTGDMVRGVYGGSGEGTHMITVPGQPQPVPTPSSFISTQIFQRGGMGTAANTASFAGAIFDVKFPELSIEVNPDCTATMKYTGATSEQMPGKTFAGTVKYIVLNHGNELIGMETESSIGLPITLENHKRIWSATMPPHAAYW